MGRHARWQALVAEGNSPGAAKGFFSGKLRSALAAGLASGFAIAAAEGAAPARTAASAQRAPPYAGSNELFSPDGGAGLSTTAAGQTKASLSTTSLRENKRRLRGELLNWTSLKGQELANTDGQATTQNFIGLNYKVGPSSTLSIRLPFIHSYEFPKTRGANSDVHAQDIYLEYQNSKLFEFWTDAKLLAVSIRLGLPTGEESRFLTKTHGYARAWFAASKPLARRWNFNWHLRSHWYNQSQNTYLAANGTAVGTKNGGFDQFPEIEWKPSSRMSVTHATGTSHFWYRPGYTVPTKQDFLLSSWTAFNLQANDEIALTLAISNDADFNPAGGRAFGPFRSDETAYHFILAANL